jgi:hypothetical protein
MRRSISFILAFSLLGLSLFGAFKFGEVKAVKRERNALAIAALWTVQPAIQIIDFSERNEGAIPEPILTRAHGSVFMVANLSYLFAKEPLKLNEDSQNVLCAIAKARERYQKRDPYAYGPALMDHLAGIEKELVNRNSKLACSV